MLGQSLVSRSCSVLVSRQLNTADGLLKAPCGSFGVLLAVELEGILVQVGGVSYFLKLLSRDLCGALVGASSLLDGEVDGFRVGN